MKQIYPILFCGIMVCNTANAQQTSDPDMASAEFDSEEFVTADVILNRFTARDFNVSYNAQNSVTITWTAVPKTTTTSYTILRSSNGKSFNTWRTVQTSGASGQQSYLEVDQKPLAKTAYYRLVQNDDKGESAYSEIRLVKPVDDDKKTMLEVYPYTEDNAENAGDVLIVMQDNKGETFYSRAYYKLENGNVSGISLHQELPAGTYVITASSKDDLIGNTFVIK
jgi:hypothetical protein